MAVNYCGIGIVLSGSNVIKQYYGNLALFHNNYQGNVAS
jgi:hypothetical protein